MYNYLINYRPVLLGAPLQLGALSVRLVRLWVNPTLFRTVPMWGKLPLGVVISSPGGNLTRNSLVSYILSKCAKPIYCIRNLSKVGVPAYIGLTYIHTYICESGLVYANYNIQGGPKNWTIFES